MIHKKLGLSQHLDLIPGLGCHLQSPLLFSSRSYSHYGVQKVIRGAWHRSRATFLRQGTCLEGQQDGNHQMDLQLKQLVTFSRWW